VINIGVCHHNWLFCIHICKIFLWYWVWTQGFILVRQTLYCLNHTSSPFFSGYFGDKVSLFAQAGLNHNSPIFKLPTITEWQACTTRPSFFCWDANFFVQGWPRAKILPILASHIVWDNRHVSLCPTTHRDCVLLTIGLGWPQTTMHLISASQVARIVGLSQCAQLWIYFCKVFFSFDGK
jgi:hypothetical protein